MYTHPPENSPPTLRNLLPFCQSDAVARECETGWENTNMQATASEWQNRSKFRKVGGEFSGGWVYILLEEKCYHTIWKVFRGLLLAGFRMWDWMWMWMWNKLDRRRISLIWKLSKWFLCVVEVNFDCCRSKLYAVIVHSRRWHSRATVVTTAQCE